MAQLFHAALFQPEDSVVATGLVQSAEGDYVLAGRSFVANGDSAAVAVRAQADGVIAWQQTYRSQYTQFFSAITQIADGSFIATGSKFYSEFAGDEYIWVVKLDADGNLVWEKTFGSEDTQSDGLAVVACQDGGFAVTGLKLSKITNRGQTRLIKFAANGGVEWDHDYEGGIAYDLTQTVDQGFALSGAANIPGSLNSYVYLLRVDPSGVLIWEQTDREFEVYVLINSGVTQTHDGNFVVVAKSVVLKTDGNGAKIWGYQGDNLGLGSVVETTEGNYAIAGYLIVDNFEHAYVAAINSEGSEIVWDNTDTLYNSGIAQVIVNQNDFVAGAGFGPAGNMNNLMFLAVYNPVRFLRRA